MLKKAKNIGNLNHTAAHQKMLFLIIRYKRFSDCDANAESSSFNRIMTIKNNAPLTEGANNTRTNSPINEYIYKTYKKGQMGKFIENSGKCMTVEIL